MQPENILAWKRGSEPKVRPLTTKVFVIDTKWERENRFSPMQCQWVCQLHSRAGLMPSSSWATRNRLYVSLCFVWASCFVWNFVFLTFCFDFWILLLIPCLAFVWQWKLQVWSWAHMEAGTIWQELGDGERICSKLILGKKIKIKIKEIIKQ